MKITKQEILNSSISVGALALIIPGLLWLTNKADKEEVKEVKKEVIEEKIVNREQSILIENATENMKEQTVLMNKLYDKLMEGK